MNGDNRFVDFIQESESEMPFAIECVGNEFVIGRSAMEEATKNLGTNAFINIFDTCKQMKTFRFAGREEPLSKLPYYAIRFYISKILSDRFYGAEGVIDDNVSELPLIFLFTPELDTDKKLFIISPFQKGGFHNLCSISYHQLLLPTIMESLPDKDRCEVAIMVSVDENDLLLHIYDVKKGTIIDDSIRIEGLGCDPRLKQAADLIWSRLYNYNYQQRELEEDILKEAALSFLNCNERSVNGELRMSDGSMQPYFLRRADLDTSSIAEDYGLVKHRLDIVLSNHDLQIQQCQIILVGGAATDYFEQMFNRMPLSVPIKKVLGREKNLMLSRLLSMVKQANYEVNNLFSTSPEGPSPLDAEPSLEDKRSVRTKIAEIKAKIRCNDANSALELIYSLKDWLQENGFSKWDSELETLLRNAQNINAVEPIAQPEPSEIKKIRQEARRKLAEIKALVRNGKREEALKLLTNIQTLLHSKKITEFDVELENISKGFQNNIKEEIPLKNAQSEATQLLQNGMFAEAKRIFAKENDSDMAQICSKLIKAKRDIDRYASGLESVKRSHNSTSKQNAIKELESCKTLYRKYKVDINGIEQLIAQYKTI